MRDVLVLAIILGSVPICFIRPFFGAMMWVWVAYFNPHRFAYGMAYNFPVSTVIAIPTLLGLLFFRKVNRGILVRETVVLLVFWAWITITYINATQVQLFADHVEDAQFQLIRVSKVLLMTVVLILVVNSKKRLDILFLVTAFSFGVLAIKGSLFGYSTGGGFRVYGPPDSFVYDNNDLGLALNMTLPVMYYMTREVESPRVRKLLWVSFYCSILTVILSYSRGALLGLVVVLGAISIRSNRKILAGALLIVLAFLVVSFAPSAWMNRMGDFAHGELDESAQGRLHAWQFAWELALRYPITGGGFETFTPDLEERLTPQFSFAGPHSIYFQTLGEQGFVGLGIFLCMLGGCFYSLWRIRRRVRGQPSFSWVTNYSQMLETCLLGYAVSGAFLPRAYFDLWFQLVAATALLKILYEHARLNDLTEEVSSGPDETDVVEMPVGVVTHIFRRTSFAASALPAKSSPRRWSDRIGTRIKRITLTCLGSTGILLVFQLLVFVPSSTCGQTWKWTTETVDTFGIQTSIAVDQHQNLHISYFSGGVKYGFRPADSSHWFTMDIAPPAGYEEIFTRISLDPDGNPHICFTPAVLKYAAFENRRWNIQQIDPQSGLIEYSCSLAIAADGTRHVLWYQYGNPQGGYYLHLKYAVLEKGAWMARTLDFDMQAGKWNCMVLDSQGNPHVSYDSFINGEMKYAYWDGKEWKRTVIDSPGISPNGPYSHGLGNSLVLNRDGKAQISYEDGELGAAGAARFESSLKYAWEKDGSWKIDTVANITVTSSWIGYRTRQALDPQGNPHIVYEDAGAVKHAYRDGSEWRTQVISAPGSKRHRYENIAIDRAGNIYISYQDAVDGSLKVTIGRPQAPAQDSSNERKPVK